MASRHATTSASPGRRRSASLDADDGDFATPRRRFIRCVAVLLLDLDAPASTLRARADAAAALFGVSPVDLLVIYGSYS